MLGCIYFKNHVKKKLGRNDPCWCGSGLKYKKCHLNRHLKPRPTIEESIKTFNKIFDKRYCLHPGAKTGNCDGDIVRAHTVQRSGGLSKIAHTKHVYRLMPKLSYSPPSFSIIPKRIGINEASTFTGFCQIHDTKTFERIEKVPFTAEVDQIFLLAYRALSREVFMKSNQLELIDFMHDQDKGLDTLAQIEFQGFIKSYGYGVALGAATMNRQKEKYDKALLNDVYTSLNYYVAYIEETPEFLCSGTSIVETDFLGRGYNQLGRSDIEQEIITFSIVPIDDGGAIVFATLDNGDDIKSFFQSIVSLNETELPNAFARYTFEYYENTFISPLWWDKLDSHIKESIIDRFSSGLKPDDIREKNCLMDDGIEIVNWSIHKVVSNINAA